MMKFSAVLACVVSVGLSMPVIAQANHPVNPVSLMTWIPLPGIEGDFDFLTLDTKRNHVIIAAEEHHSLEVFDAATGEHLQSVPGVKTPHTLAYVSEKDELLVADGGDYSTLFLSAADFHQVDRVQLIDGSATGKTDSPDVGYYDAARRTFFIGNGGKSAKLPYSEITAINVDSHKITGRIRVEGINLEAIAIDQKTDRLYVNIRDMKQIGVIDLKSMKVIDTWATPDLNLNTSMSLDEANHRLFVVGRKPGIFYVFDTTTGKVVQQLPCVNIADGMAWDAASKKIYVFASQGMSVIHQDSPDHYSVLANLPTNGGKTGLLLPQSKQLFVVHPKTSIDDAGLLVYRVNQ
jgi:DNA-binding beta-propeller fold protein YncE